MPPPTSSNVRLDRSSLKGRSFILGNKRALSLSLPAAAGSSQTLLHPHKWFGAYAYGRKFLEAQAVFALSTRRRLLGSRYQTGCEMTLTTARREYEVDGIPCSETYFVPDAINGFACTLAGHL